MKATLKDKLALVGYGIAFVGLVYLAAYIRHLWSSFLFS
jgi:hypothetical protein